MAGEPPKKKPSLEYGIRPGKKSDPVGDLRQKRAGLALQRAKTTEALSNIARKQREKEALRAAEGGDTGEPAVESKGGLLSRFGLGGNKTTEHAAGDTPKIVQAQPPVEAPADSENAARVAETFPLRDIKPELRSKLQFKIGNSSGKKSADSDGPGDARLYILFPADASDDDIAHVESALKTKKFGVKALDEDGKQGYHPEDGMTKDNKQYLVLKDTQRIAIFIAELKEMGLNKQFGPMPNGFQPTKAFNVAWQPFEILLSLAKKDTPART